MTRAELIRILHYKYEEVLERAQINREAVRKRSISIGSDKSGDVQYQRLITIQTYLEEMSDFFYRNLLTRCNYER